MPLKILIVDDAQGYLSVKVVGRGALADIFAMIDTVTSEASRRGLRRVLVDQTEIDEDLKFTDHFSIGERVVRLFGNFEKVASIVRATRRTGTSEKVAQKMGVELRVFTNADEAHAWVRS